MRYKSKRALPHSRYRLGVPNKRRSRVQDAICAAASAYAKANRLRGGAAYHIAKVSRLPLSSVQGFLGRDSRHLATVEAIADALGLRITVEDKGIPQTRDMKHR